MKKLFQLLFLITLLFSCEEKVKENHEKKGEKIPLETPKETSKKQRQKKINQRGYLDSLRMDEILKEALSISKNKISEGAFKKEYESIPDDSSMIYEVNIDYGNLFSKNINHLLIKRMNSWEAQIDVFLNNNGNLQHILNRELDGMTYLRDTMKDVNGDGRLDFLVHWYPVSGCCRRDVYNVYLQSEKNTFSEDYRFINPTFYPKEKIIRGVMYGHPGEMGLYKYAWNDLNVDTIEFIYPNQIDTLNRHFFKTKKWMYLTEENERIKLKKIPSEYHDIESYDWFTWY